MPMAVALLRMIPGGGMSRFEAERCGMPPGVSLDEEELGQVVVSTVAEPRQSQLFTALDQLGAYHPHEPHW